MNSTYLLAVLLTLPAMVGWSAPTRASAPAGETASACPIRNQTHKARLVATELTGHSQQPVVLKIVLEPPTVPSGFFVTSLVDVDRSPEGKRPKVVTGYPNIRVVCYEPGEYRLRVRINLIAKSSCGGVKAGTLNEEVVLLTIVP